MSRRKSQVAAAALVLAFGPAAHAETFHVAPGGDDDASGTQEAPFATVQRAVAEVGPGDEVTVAAGSYAGFTVEDVHGQPDAPIIFRADGEVIIEQAGPRPSQPPINSATGDHVWVRWPVGVTVLRSSHIVVRGFTVRDMPGAETIGGALAHKGGMGFRAEACHHVTFSHNVADRNGRWGIFSSFCDDLVIVHNQLSRSAQEHGVYVSNSSDRPVVAHNEIWGNAMCGVHMNSDNNWHDEAYEAFATVDGVIRGATVEGNTIRDNGRDGGAAINFDGVQDARIVNNLLLDNHATGVALYQQNGAEGARRNVVVNNTILMAGDGRYAINILDCPYIGAGGVCTTANEPFLPSWMHPTAYATGSTGNALYNNIVHHPSSARGAILTDAASLEPDAVSGTALQSDHNAFVDRFTIGGSSLDLDGWRSATRGDAHSFTAAPAEVLANPAGGDYTPALDGGAFDGGTALHAPDDDLRGTPRPQGEAVDIGAFESCGGAPCEPPAGGAGGAGGGDSRPGGGGLDGAGGQATSTSGGGPGGNANPDPAGGDGATPPAGATPPGGCGACCVAHAPTAGGGLAAVLLLLVAALRRRRAR